MITIKCKCVCDFKNIDCEMKIKDESFFEKNRYRATFLPIFASI